MEGRHHGHSDVHWRGYSWATLQGCRSACHLLYWLARSLPRFGHSVLVWFYLVPLCNTHRHVPSVSVKHFDMLKLPCIVFTLHNNGTFLIFRLSDHEVHHPSRNCERHRVDPMLTSSRLDCRSTQLLERCSSPLFLHYRSDDMHTRLPIGW